ncbi:hypothetical protein [Paenibacillus chitinolyticus]|uniref:hypothetical protein n=1 Tax=Paenibacillus chitinolyticus TaxID=79263 RepID=UPI0036712CA2
MGNLNLPRVEPGMTPEQLGNLMGLWMKELIYIFDGMIDTDNVREIAGWIANQFALTSKDGKVGMSTSEEGEDPVRFFAGDNWKVTRSGKMTATGALIQSVRNAYPRVEISPDKNLFGAYQTPNDALVIVPSYSGGPPNFYMVQNGSAIFEITQMLGIPSIFTLATVDLNISGGGNLNLTANTGKVQVTNWNQLKNKDTGHTLQQDLDAKLNSTPVHGTVYVSSTPGGPATVPITFTNGVRTG